MYILLGPLFLPQGANRWSKPHVSSLSLHSLMDLRTLLKSQTVFLDLKATNLREIMEVFHSSTLHFCSSSSRSPHSILLPFSLDVQVLLENMVATGQLSYDKMGPVMNAVLHRHRHQFEGMRKVGTDIY